MKMNSNSWIKALLAIAVLAGGTLCLAQTKPSGTGTLSVALQNGSGLQFVFNSDSSGVTLGNAGTSAASLGFGTVSAYGTPAAGVTLTNGTSSFTVSTKFDVNVSQSGLTSTSYTMTAALAAAAPTGVTLQIGSTTLTTSSQTIQTTGSYGSNTPYTLNAVILTAASGSGGPTTGTQLTSTINFTVTSN